MKNKSRFSKEQVLEMKLEHASGIGYRKLAKKYNCATSTIQYNVNDDQREKIKERHRKYYQTHVMTEKQKITHNKYMKSPAGLKAVAKSWIRKYLRDAIISKEDVIEVLDEFTK